MGVRGTAATVGLGAATVWLVMGVTGTAATVWLVGETGTAATVGPGEETGMAVSSAAVANWKRQPWHVLIEINFHRMESSPWKGNKHYGTTSAVDPE